MDADSFSLMVAEPADFDGRFGKLRRHALYLCAAHYRESMGVSSDRGRREIMGIVRPKLKAYAKQEYGSAILIFIAVTILGACLSWAAQRFLNWLWPDKSAQPNRERLEIARAIRLSEQAQ